MDIEKVRHEAMCRKLQIKKDKEWLTGTCNISDKENAMELILKYIAEEKRFEICLNHIFVQIFLFSLFFTLLFPSLYFCYFKILHYLFHLTKTYL